MVVTELLVAIISIGTLSAIFIFASSLKREPKDKIGIFLAIFIFVMSLISCFAFPSLDNPSGNDTLALFCTISIIFALVIRRCILFIINIKEQILIEQTNAQKQQLEYDKKAKDFYLKTNKSNYDIKNDEVLEVLSSTYEVTKKEIKSLYDRGKKVIEEEKEEQIKKTKKQELDKRNKEEQKVEKERVKTLTVGKEKYISYLKESRRVVSSIKNIYNFMSKECVSNASEALNTNQSDPYFYAGMANGIAGQAAAIMTFDDIKKENAKERELTKEIAKNSLDKARTYGQVAREEETRISNIVSEIDRYTKNIEDALINNNTNRLKDLIDIEVKDIHVTKTNMINVTVKNNLKDIKILDKKGVLDGSFVVKVLNSKDKVIAIGYYNGNNVYVDLETKFVSISNLGFNNKENIITCMTNNEFEKEVKSGYYCIFEPINLWIIEQKWK